jgi:hypothetical protein
MWFCAISRKLGVRADLRNDVDPIGRPGVIGVRFVPSTAGARQAETVQIDHVIWINTGRDRVLSSGSQEQHWSIRYRLQECQARILTIVGTSSVPNQRECHEECYACAFSCFGLDDAGNCRFFERRRQTNGCRGRRRSRHRRRWSWRRCATPASAPRRTCRGRLRTPPRSRPRPPLTSA